MSQPNAGRKMPGYGASVWPFSGPVDLRRFAQGPREIKHAMIQSEKAGRKRLDGSLYDPPPPFFLHTVILGNSFHLTQSAHTQTFHPDEDDDKHLNR